MIEPFVHSGPCLNFLSGKPLGCICKKLNRGMRRAIERDMVPRMKKAGLIGPPKFDS